MDTREGSEQISYYTIMSRLLEIRAMSDPNFAQQAGNFAVDAEVDTVADNLINQGVDMIASHIPGGEGFEQQLRTEVDQVVNNAINNEVNKGTNGVMQDVEGFLHKD